MSRTIGAVWSRHQDDVLELLAPVAALVHPQHQAAGFGVQFPGREIRRRIAHGGDHPGDGEAVLPQRLLGEFDGDLAFGCPFDLGGGNARQHQQRFPQVLGGEPEALGGKGFGANGECQRRHLQRASHHLRLLGIGRWEGLDAVDGGANVFEHLRGLRQRLHVHDHG